MIDLHIHLLPGVDDGPADAAGMLELARAAAASGTREVVATPHVDERHGLDPGRVAGLVATARDVLRDAGVELTVRAGAEIAPDRMATLADEELERLRLGAGRHLLLECPFLPVGPGFEALAFGVGLRGFPVVLAHPERSPSFQRDPERLRGLVERGAIVQVTGSSLSGAFGGTVRAAALELLHRGLVHVIASDAHDPVSRHPRLRGTWTQDRALLPIADHLGYFAEQAPRAILDGSHVPAPPTLARGRGLRRRLLRAG